MPLADDVTLHETRDCITQQVLNVVPPDDEPAEGRPWSWLAEPARPRKLNVIADDLWELRTR